MFHHPTDRQTDTPNVRPIGRLCARPSARPRDRPTVRPTERPTVDVEQKGPRVSTLRQGAGRVRGRAGKERVNHGSCLRPFQEVGVVRRTRPKTGAQDSELEEKLGMATNFVMSHWGLEESSTQWFRDVHASAGYMWLRFDRIWGNIGRNLSMSANSGSQLTDLGRVLAQFRPNLRRSWPNQARRWPKLARDRREFVPLRPKWPGIGKISGTLTGFGQNSAEVGFRIVEAQDSFESAHVRRSRCAKSE